MQKTFHTPEPAVLFVEIGSGRVSVEAADVTETVITVTGAHADEVIVEQHDHQIAVVAPKKLGFFGNARELVVEATVPTHSELGTRLGSANLVATGTLGWVKLNSGSGDISVDEVSAEAVAKSGSGDIEIDSIDGAANLTTGSGDIKVGSVSGAIKVSTGSGDVAIGRTGAAVALKSGSGDLQVHVATGDVVLSSASGDLRIDRFPSGRITAKNASGDIEVGIPAGVPVWTDVMSVSGTVRSDLEGAGQPTEGQEYVELRAKTVSGNVRLQQV